MRRRATFGLIACVCILVLSGCGGPQVAVDNRSRMRSFEAQLPEVLLTLHTAPMGALVYRLENNADPRGQLVGTTPITLSIRSSLGYSFRFEFDGYMSRTEFIEPRHDRPEITVDLALRRIIPDLRAPAADWLDIEPERRNLADPSGESR